MEGGREVRRKSWMAREGSRDGDAGDVNGRPAWGVNVSSSLVFERCRSSTWKGSNASFKVRRDSVLDGKVARIERSDSGTVRLTV